MKAKFGPRIFETARGARNQCIGSSLRSRLVFSSLHSLLVEDRSLGSLLDARSVAAFSIRLDSAGILVSANLAT